MGVKTHKHTIDILFVLILFCVFAFSVIMVLGTGAGVYSNIVDGMEANYDFRTSSAYLFNKVHRSDAGGNVRCGTFGDSDALLLLEEIDNIYYCTYLYYYDGALMELFTRYGQDIAPEYGTEIMKLDSYKLKQLSPSLYEFEIVSEEGESSVLYVHTRTRSVNDDE
ncbi:MAG: DUF4860 domain-containing protein [Lachnospiraceae bacterium]|nr:DUF4860 domain-containing protein [Lachnospiraceae bacterium]